MYNAPKIKDVLNIDKIGLSEEQRMLMGFNVSKKILERFQYFKKIERKKMRCCLKAGKKFLIVELSYQRIEIF